MDAYVLKAVKAIPVTTIVHIIITFYMIIFHCALQSLVDVFDNVLEDTNTQGWLELQTVCSDSSTL